MANATEFVVVKYGIPGIFSALIARPPPNSLSNCFIAIQFNVKRKRIWENIFGDE